MEYMAHGRYMINPKPNLFYLALLERNPIQLHEMQKKEEKYIFGIVHFNGSSQN